MGCPGGPPWSEEVWLTQKVTSQGEALVEMCLALVELSLTNPASAGGYS